MRRDFASLTAAGQAYIACFATSDIVQVLPGGTCQFLGRASEMVKLDGALVSLQSIEQAAMVRPTVAHINASTCVLSLVPIDAINKARRLWTAMPTFVSHVRIISTLSGLLLACSTQAVWIFS